MKLFSRKSTAEDDINEALEAPGSQVDENFVRPLRIGLLALVIGFGGFVGWGAFAPLDEGEPANGVVEVVGNRKTIQHLEGGTVDAILVRDGDRVAANQVLLRLNPTRALSDRGVASSQYIIARTTEDRLQAERDGLENIAFDEELAKRFHDDPRYQRAISAQEELFGTRRAALKGEIAILRENLAGAQTQLDGLLQVQASRKEQISYINKELAGVRELAKDGYLPRNRLLELERDAAQLQGALSNAVVDAGRTRNQIAELKLRVLQREQDYQKEVQSQLSDVQKEVSSLANRLASLDYSVAQTEIRSPIEGTVQNLKIHTVGGVIAPGAELMEIIPDDASYVVNAEVPVQAIDRVYPGLPVEITFPALNHAKTPSVPGELVTISADRITDQRTGIPYYQAKVKLLPEGEEMVKAVGGDIRAGMPATVMIKLGERTLFSYLLKPFLERLHTSLTEK
ncbi:HlyD family type I secretion periplasmic adaptor subunit [Castellaniella sp.]|uniref:HlyD family type I secretion periplasmic adaptor subunit n=1 Tax=Castellaniella sp. TaxID=1955812 RepID=UPI002AFE6878|nr:HlyD family type I secretion periplasmic adaptor subunit [Castellaniella sp.]